MRTKEEIVEQLEEARFVKDEFHPEGYKQSWKPVPVEIELLLDIRELLLNTRNK